MILKRKWWLLLVLGLGACQPQNPSDAREGGETSADDTPIVVNEDSVAMASDDILSIKSSRYQPSLGLQGTLEPINQIIYRAQRAAEVTQILVQPEQWVEKDTPLMVLQVKNSAQAEGSQTEAQRAPDGHSEAEIQEQAAESRSPLLADNMSESVAASQKTLLVRAPFAGRVDKLYVEEGASVPADAELLHIADSRTLKFVAAVPLQAKSQLSVGQTVSFSTEQRDEKFTGQISELVASHVPNQLLVAVHVIQKEGEVLPLQSGMAVTGRVNYGQIEVGTIVPERGIHDADLSALKSPPYQPLSPLTANVWIIKQDQRLMRQPVEVIEYDPDTKQYLVAGISNDSLICLADLPIASAGKKVVIS
ncbi:efflux RND transporter periplasmic adaptor subunit [Psychrobacter aestuarii]|uniref:efflux RND transporter periplasmic adaptor subunit n=1 Tax=Psychrobacter aestuarii TaxID=556327 RepID=UPI001D120A66|nr:HlyD family efflux transporter periplasmic adaptor subunit [Psychrobacter aestuarii]